MKQATVTVQYKVEETKVQGNWAKVTQLASSRAGTQARPPKSRVRAFNHLTLLFPKGDIKIHTNLLCKIAWAYFNISTMKPSLTDGNET